MGCEDKEKLYVNCLTLHCFLRGNITDANTKQTSLRTFGPWRFNFSHFFLLTIYSPCLHEFNPSSSLIFKQCLSLPPSKSPCDLSEEPRTEEVAQQFLSTMYLLIQPFPFPRTVHVRDRVMCHNVSNNGGETDQEPRLLVSTIWFMKHSNRDLGLQSDGWFRKIRLGRVKQH